MDFDTIVLSKSPLTVDGININPYPQRNMRTQPDFHKVRNAWSDIIYKHIKWSKEQENKSIV